MRSGVRFVAVLFVAGALAAAGSRVPDLLGRLEVFRVQEFRMEGNRFLDRDEAIRWAAVPPGASVWDDPGRWEEELRGHPLVLEVRVKRDLPHTLVFEVREREPVALVPDPVLEPVDGAGRALPVDPGRHRLDLPLVRPVRSGTDARLTPDELRSVVAEVGRLDEVNPRFLASVSDVSMGARNHLVARLMEPRVELHFRPPLTARRLREGLQALADARDRIDGEAPRSVDLRYEDQVVIGLANDDVRASD